MLVFELEENQVNDHNPLNYKGIYWKSSIDPKTWPNGLISKKILLENSLPCMGQFFKYSQKYEELKFVYETEKLIDSLNEYDSYDLSD